MLLVKRSVSGAVFTATFVLFSMFDEFDEDRWSFSELKRTDKKGLVPVSPLSHWQPWPRPPPTPRPHLHQLLLLLSERPRDFSHRLQVALGAGGFQGP